MTLSDLYAAQIEAHFFFYIALGGATLCVCLTIYTSAKIIAEAIAQQKIVIEKPVYDASAVYNHWLNRSATGETTFAQSQ